MSIYDICVLTFVGVSTIAEVWTLCIHRLTLEHNRKHPENIPKGMVLGAPKVILRSDHSVGRRKWPKQRQRA